MHLMRNINFSNSINENDEPKSLLPDFPLFAIPRRFIREHFEFYELSTYFTEIILNSVENNNFKQIVFDFRTPQTSTEIKRTIARFLEDKKFVNLTSFGFIENNESNISDLELSIIKFTFFINKIYKNKFYQSKLRTKKFDQINGMKIRHWFQLKDKFRDHLAIQPKDIGRILLELKSGNNKPNELGLYDVDAIAKFIALSTLSNLLSQIAHSSKLHLKNTLSKNLLFPEVIGDCPGGCYFHLDPFKLPELILIEVKKQYGLDMSLSIKKLSESLSENYYEEFFMNLDRYLEILIEDEITHDLLTALKSKLAEHPKMPWIRYQQ